MPQSLATLKLSSTLQRLQSGVLPILAGKTSRVDPTAGKVTATQTVAGSVAANADFAVAVANWNRLSSAPVTKQGALQAHLPANFQIPTVQ